MALVGGAERASLADREGVSRARGESLCVWRAREPWSRRVEKPRIQRLGRLIERDEVNRGHGRRRVLERRNGYGGGLVGRESECAGRDRGKGKRRCLEFVGEGQAASVAGREEFWLTAVSA